MDLKRLEAGLRRLVESQLMRALPRQGPEDRIVHRMTEAMQTGARIDAAGSRIAPNHYTIAVRAGSIDDWRNPQLIETLLGVLKEASDQAGLRFATPPSIEFVEDPGAGPGEFRVEASHRDQELRETQEVTAYTPAQSSSGEAAAIPENAFLIVGGAKEYALRATVINIGRRLDNDLVIEDPRVSRHHAQLRAIDGRFVLFDLESSGGSFINGQRRSQSILYSGDVISLAGVALIYGQDTPLAPPPVHATAPRKSAGGEQPTAFVGSTSPGENPTP